MNYPRFKNEPVTQTTAVQLDTLYPARGKKEAFLSALITLGSEHCADAITTYSGKPLEQVSNLFDVSINVNRLIDCDWASSGEQIVRYALACVYNSGHTIEVLQTRLLAQLQSEGYIKILRDDDGYAPKFPAKALFSASCTSLDEKNKELLCKLINNYHGW
ncbi:MAG: hypothetical protein Alis3KO_07830 [Aliiglaciecola sp.]